MNFEIENNGASVTLRLKERKLDSTVSPTLKGEFVLICKRKVEKLNVDLSAVEFCDSSGLSALLIADRKMKEHGGKVILRNVHKNVHNLIKISMLDRVFEIHEAHQPAKH